MGCTRPLLAYRDKKNGTVKIIGALSTSDKLDNIAAVKRAFSEGRWEKLVLPCGQCAACRLAYSREWADRCYLESKLHKNNFWLTLTYDDEHLPLIETIDKKTGEVITIGTLVRKDLQDFLKRLRDHYKYHYNHTGIRYFGCGEYGTQYHRPHYHITIFNLPIPDLKAWYWKDGWVTSQSESITKLWGKGLVTINVSSWATCAYTARYMLKKAKGRDAKEQFAESGLTPEFVACSLKPAIGLEYYQIHKNEIYNLDKITIKKSGSVVQRKPPRYFDKLMERENPELLERVKRARKNIAESQMKFKLLYKTSLNRIEYFKIEEKALEEKTKATRRKYEQGMK